MKHYRIVKKSTYFLIAISALAIFFTLSIFGAQRLGLLKLDLPNTISADIVTCDSGTNFKIELEDPNTNKQINTEFFVNITSTDTETDGRHYKYKFYILDVATDKSYSAGDESGSFLGTSLSEDSKGLIITGTGPKKIYAYYSRSKDPGGSDRDPHCTWQATEGINITGVDNRVDSSNITLTVAEKTEKPGSVPITYKILGGQGKNYVLYVSAGGECSSSPLNATGCWWQKYKEYNITSNDYDKTVPWNTTMDNTDIGRHGVKLIVYQDDEENPLDSKTVYTTICAPGTLDSCVPDNDGEEDGGSTEDRIVTPPEIEAFSRFANPFKLPREKITGAGDFVVVVVLLIEYLIGVFAFFGIVISGIQYISSGGDPSKAEKAKKNLIYSIIGIVVAVLALSIQSIAAKFWLGSS